MRAKFINEIKRDGEYKGLGSIGVGHTHLTQTANKLKKDFPWLLSNKRLGDELYSYLNSVKNHKDVMESYINKIKEELIDLNDYVLLNTPSRQQNETLLQTIGDYIEQNFMGEMNSDGYKTIFYYDWMKEGVSYQEYIASYLCYGNVWHDIWYVGLTDFLDTPKNIFQHFFVRI